MVLVRFRGGVFGLIGIKSIGCSDVVEIIEIGD